MVARPKLAGRDEAVAAALDGRVDLVPEERERAQQKRERDDANDDQPLSPDDADSPESTPRAAILQRERFLLLFAHKRRDGRVV